MQFHNKIKNFVIIFVFSCEQKDYWIAFYKKCTSSAILVISVKEIFAESKNHHQQLAII